MGFGERRMPVVFQPQPPLGAGWRREYVHREGRPIFQDDSNPYTYDRAYIDRKDMAREKAGERLQLQHQATGFAASAKAQRPRSASTLSGASRRRPQTGGRRPATAPADLLAAIAPSRTQSAGSGPFIEETARCARPLPRSQSTPGRLEVVGRGQAHIPGYKGHVPGYNLDMQEALGHSFGRATAVLGEIQRGQAGPRAKLPHHGGSGRPFREAARGGPRTPVAKPFEVKLGWM